MRNYKHLLRRDLSRAMPKAMRGRPRKLDGSPRTEAWREKERARRQEQFRRKALGQSRHCGRPSKRGAAPEATKPDLVADQVAEPDNLSRSSSLKNGAKRSKTPAAQRARHKPPIPDGNPDSPQPPATSRMAVRALAICTAAPALEPQVAAEELCVICKQDKLDCPAGVQLPRYLPCCTSRIHTTCLARWRTSVLKNGQMMANAHNCPTCMIRLVGTRDLRDTAPTAADMRKFLHDRGGVKRRPRLEFDRGALMGTNDSCE